MLFISSNLFHIQITKMKSNVTKNSQSWGWEWKGEFCHMWLLGLKCCPLSLGLCTVCRDRPSPLWIFSQNIFCTPEWFVFCSVVDFCSELHGLQNALIFQTKWRFTLCLILLSPVPLGVANSWEMPADPNKSGKPLKAEIRLKAAGWFFFFNSHSN